MLGALAVLVPAGARPALAQATRSVSVVAGQGTVTSTPAGISCSGGGVGTCAAPLPTSQVTLAATPLGENVFTGWTGACSGSGATCTLTVGGSGFVAATANFTAQQPGVRVITVEGRGSGSGTVTSTPGAILGNIVNGVAITDGPSVLALRPGQELELADVRDPAGAGGAARSRILLRGAISSGALLQADVPGSATASQYSASAQQVAARASGDYAQRADVSACQLTAR